MDTLSPSISAVDLFCGVGGLTHGLARAGVDVRLGVDVDPACKFPYEENNNSRFLEKDVDELKVSEIASELSKGRYSLLAGCAPCQPFSTYSQGDRGKSRGQDWRLLRRFGTLVEQLQPDFVTMENVPQLKSHKVFQDFILSLRGYDLRSARIQCSRVGVPQSRQRLVLVASRHGPLGRGVDAETSLAPTVRETIGKLPLLRAGESNAVDPLHISPQLSPLNMQRIRASAPGGTWRDWDKSLLSHCHQKDTGATYPSVYGRMEWDKIAPTITTQCFGYGNGRFGHPDQDRAISLREAAMLQTFPEEYKFVRSGELVRFNRLGRLIGNAVPVRLGEAIGRLIREEVDRLFSRSY
ncbi:DNA cytosine methyltransferase [Actinomycetospora aurantiaca]|uniref:DNA cytosine methyltransferase n=1 Tax=Actinomycetospora aurantiaca TaxID=3129233 RepID=UPI0035A155C4